MIARLTAFENEQSEDDEERREGLAVFDVDDRFQVLTDEKLAHENQSDVQQRPKGAETCFKRNVDSVACGREVFVLATILFALVGPTNADIKIFFSTYQQDSSKLLRFGKIGIMDSWVMYWLLY